MAVFADETRPFLQGARLTAWELVKDGIDTTVITDNMTASMMRLAGIDLVVVGADRIAANGDVANKIGTYGVAVLAKEHGIPFYVAAPLSTIDLRTADGSGIPIEERNDREVTHVGGYRVTPEGARIRNPAFDVTPAKYVTAIITEQGIARAPYGESLAALVRAGAAAPMLNAGTRHRNLVRRDVGRDRRGERRRCGRPWRVRSNVVASQVDIHRAWGGIVPELSARQHIRDICGVVERAVEDAGPPAAGERPYDLIAVTQGPGLVGLAAGRPVVCQVAGVGARRAVRAGAPSGGPHRVARARGRGDAAAGRRARRLRRPHQPVPRGGAWRLRASRPHA